MAHMNMVQAINDALRHEMRRDSRVVVLGEDVGKVGGVFRVTQGLFDEFGDDRVIDTPLSEGGIIGSAVGMALYGLRPVPEIQFADFIYPAYDQIVSELAKMRYRSGGEYPAPVVIRTPVGGGIRGGHYHSQSPEALFTHVPGLQVVCPSNPIDAKGLLASAIRGDDPVIFMEPKRVYRASKADVPEGEYTLPIGKAKVVREGSDVTLVTYSIGVGVALDAANQLSEQGIEAEVIDLRTLRPLDRATVLKSLAKTNRMVCVEEGWPVCSISSELMAVAMEEGFDDLDAPVLRATNVDVPLPYAANLEKMALIKVADVVAAAKKVSYK